MPQRSLVNAGFRRHIGKRSIMVVVKQRSVRRCLFAVERVEGRAVDEINIQPAIVVIVDQANARALRLHDVVLAGVPILCVHLVSPAFSEMSSKITGPVFTNPPAVIGRICASSWAAWGLSPALLVACCNGTCFEGGVLCAKRHALNPAAIAILAATAHTHRNMIVSIRTRSHSLLLDRTGSDCGIEFY